MMQKLAYLDSKCNQTIYPKADFLFLKQQKIIRFTNNVISFGYSLFHFDLPQ